MLKAKPSWKSRILIVISAFYWIPVILWRVLPSRVALTQAVSYSCRFAAAKPPIRSSGHVVSHWVGKIVACLVDGTRYCNHNPQPNSNPELLWWPGSTFPMTASNDWIKHPRIFIKALQARSHWYSTDLIAVILYINYVFKYQNVNRYVLHILYKLKITCTIKILQDSLV